MKIFKWLSESAKVDDHTAVFDKGIDQRGEIEERCKDAVPACHYAESRQNKKGDPLIWIAFTSVRSANCQQGMAGNETTHGA
jgi:hypothetical protein